MYETQLHAAGRPGPALSGMRLCFVVNVDWYFLSHRLALARAARDAGAKVTVIAADTGRLSELAAEGFHTKPLRMGRTSRSFAGELRTVLHLLVLLVRCRPDVVHLVSVKPVLYGGVIARILRLPVLSAVTGAGSLFPVARGTAARSSRLLLLLFYAFAMRSHKGWALFQNDEDETEFLSLGLVVRGRTSVIPGSGVDPDLYQPDSPARRVGRPTVLFASRMLREKGVLDFLAAAALLRDHPMRPRFLLAGAVDENPGSIPRSEIEQLTASAGACWLGFRDLRPLLEAATVFSLPTYYREGLPKVLLEAASAGCALVTTDWPGCRAVVEHDVTGYLVPARDPVALSRAIGDLLDSEHVRRRLSDAARERVVARFSERQVLPAVLGLYGQLAR